jgi:hypothetical protein
MSNAVGGIERRLKAGKRTVGLSLVVAATGFAVLGVAGPALAATSGNGTTSLSIQGGSLSVGTVGSMTALSPTIGGSASGALPSAQWADDTGAGVGWNGTVAISPLSYTGTWTPSSGSTALATAAAGTYNGTDDGRYYTVTVTGIPTAANTPYSWTSDAAGDTGGGTGTAVNGTPATIGTKGLSITFGTVTPPYAAGSSYTVLVGTQSATAMVVDTASGAAITPSTGVSSSPPVYTDNAAAIPAGSTVGTANTAGAVKVLTAAIGTGASGTGYYTAAPGVTMTADTESWAKTYTGNLTYSIVVGP